MAIDIASGETAWKTPTGNEFTASPAVDETSVYVAGPDKRLVAYDGSPDPRPGRLSRGAPSPVRPVISGEMIWQGAEWTDGFTP